MRQEQFNERSAVANGFALGGRRCIVQRLYAMATELKDEVDRTNSKAVRSLSVVKRAQDMEKLAKQIRDRAKR